MRSIKTSSNNLACLPPKLAC